MKSMGNGLDDNEEREPSESDADAGAISDEDEAADLEDMFYVRALPRYMRTWVTDEDMEYDRIMVLASHLREHPHLPADPQDATMSKPLVDCHLIDNYIRLPYAHCPIKHCGWVQIDSQNVRGESHAPEWYLRRHLRAKHKELFSDVCGQFGAW